MKATLWNILSNKMEGVSVRNGILVPKIQRDYAQGRNTVRAREIRDEFLKNICQAVVAVKSNSGVALDLDFVYGTNDMGSFVPLDGQQRLTTLFLIHWYLAFKEKKLLAFVPVLSKFHYETRPSSNLFLRCLCKEMGDEENNQIFNLNESFEDVIKNENWYYASWNYDNTIQSIITMLESIHQVFNHSGIAIEDLINDEKEAITFNFLQLDAFGLSDSLYIKMNARGKQLTSFENLKAQLAKLIKESDFNKNYQYELVTANATKKVDVELYFVTKVDTTWSDYFWDLKDANNNFDHKLLNLLTFISLNELVVLNREQYDKAILALAELDSISYYSLNHNHLLNEESLIKYIDTLDILCSKNDVLVRFFKETLFLQDIVKPVFTDKVKADYERRVIFYGIFKFILKNKDHLDFIELQKWSRLLHNLTKNTSYDGSDNFVASLKGINSFLELYTNNLYTDFTLHSIKGFDSIQTEEELIKHHLKSKSVDWLTLIDAIENHGFLQGQISSLLVFSGIFAAYKNGSLLNLSDVELKNLHGALEQATKIFNQIFDDNGLIAFTNEEFRRALLCYGDFSIYSTNWFFYNNTNSRDLSWRRLLKEVANMGATYKVGATALIQLFSDLNTGTSVNSQLIQIIENYLKIDSLEDWKFFFIKYPLPFQYSKQHYVKFFGHAEEKFIYCLNKTKYNALVDYDFMSIVLLSELKNKNIDTDKIEFGYLKNYEQFGITHINGKSVRIVYNSLNNRLNFTIKVHGIDEFQEESLSNVVSFIIDNYFSIN